MMSMMKYIHKIYVVLQAVVIPHDIPASISSIRRALLMSRVLCLITCTVHCEIES